MTSIPSGTDWIVLAAMLVATLAVFWVSLWLPMHLSERRRRKVASEKMNAMFDNCRKERAGVADGE